MRLIELATTTAFRWAAVIAGAFVALSIALFGFIYWQTAGYERDELDRDLLHEGRLLQASPGDLVDARLQTWLAEDLHNTRYVLIVGPDGRRVFGNLADRPTDLLVDGKPRTTPAEVLTRDPGGNGRPETLRDAAFALPDGRTLVLGLDLDELTHTRAVTIRALLLGLVPMVVLALMGGAMLGWRALARIAAIDDAIARVTHGGIGERLPLRGTGDEFDRLARGVNRMLDDIERLLDEVRGVGNSVAHDLRTPLTRARLRLERSRDGIRTETEFRLAIDEALVWLDQTFAIITAILRIGEIEHGRRRAGFGPVVLAPLLREVADLYEPLADERSIRIVVLIDDESAEVSGDRDLLFEALANLVDNAVKFAGAGGACSIAIETFGSTVALRVSDHGPGIPAGDRDLVLQRFRRGEASRNSEGSGLGLSLVAAVARLHGFELAIGDNAPGCRVELRCPRISSPRAAVPLATADVA